MSDKQKSRRTGLGTSAFFTPSQQGKETPAAPAVSDTAVSQEPAAAARHVPPETLAAKVKTTINLSADTLALLDALKIQARKQKRKATYSDILDEAIRELAKQKGIEA